jgi:spore coat polysaccharide biosynthesis predicted glycosyltransferase SpsG
MTTNTIWFRADGGPRIGLGHVGRLIALAEEARRRGRECRFVLNDDPAARAFAEGRGFGRIDVAPPALDDEVAFLVDAVGEASLATDLRGKDPAFYRLLREADVWTCAFDDMGEPLVSHVVVNGDMAASFARYEEIWPPQRFLLGTDYIALPPAYAEKPPPTDDPGRTRLLVTFGGSDVADFTRCALEALADAEPLDVDLALGPAYPYVEAAREMAAQSPHRVDVYAPARDMLPLYRRARVALAAGGITQFELLSSGVPTISVPHVVREEAECAAFAAAGAVLTFPPDELRPAGAVVSELVALWSDENKRRKLARAGRGLIDGRGARRIMDVVDESAV